jgi:hypothetical protein
MAEQRAVFSKLVAMDKDSRLDLRSVVGIAAATAIAYSAEIVNSALKVCHNV